MSLSCIVQTQWQCQVISEATVPTDIFHLDFSNTSYSKNILLKTEKDMGLLMALKKNENKEMFSSLSQETNNSL